MAQAARWLEAAGVTVPRDGDGAPACTLEIGPLRALEADDVGALALPEAIEAGATWVL